MSVSITTVDLGWSTPKGQPVFSHLDLSFNRERVGILGRNGVGKTSLLKVLAGEREPGSSSVRGTVRMLRQTVQVGTDDSIANLFGVAASLDLLRRA
jgi:ATPase subunit of ABC transporter with duplicated ATPase domains